MHNWLSEMICHHFSILICLAWLNFNEEWCTSSTTVNRVTKIWAKVEHNQDVWKKALGCKWYQIYGWVAKPIHSTERLKQENALNVFLYQAHWNRPEQARPARPWRPYCRLHVWSFQNPYRRTSLWLNIKHISEFILGVVIEMISTLSNVFQQYPIYAVPHDFISTIVQHITSSGATSYFSWSLINI